MCVGIGCGLGSGVGAGIGAAIPGLGAGHGGFEANLGYIIGLKTVQFGARSIIQNI